MNLDTEIKQKEEMASKKKKLEGSIDELSREVDELKRINTDMQNINKKVQLKLSEQTIQLESAEKLAEEKAELAAGAEKKFISLNSEMTEMIITFQACEKARKEAVNELSEAKKKLLEETMLKSSSATEKRLLNEIVNELQIKLNEAIEEQRAMEEKARNSAGQVIEINGRLRQSRDELGVSEKVRKSLESQIAQLKEGMCEKEAGWMKNSRREFEILQNKVNKIKIC